MFRQHAPREQGCEVGEAVESFISIIHDDGQCARRRRFVPCWMDGMDGWMTPFWTIVRNISFLFTLPCLSIVSTFEGGEKNI